MQLASLTLLLEPRIPKRLRIRSGFPASLFGLVDDEAWYIRVEECGEMKKISNPIQASLMRRRKAMRRRNGLIDTSPTSDHQGTLSSSNGIAQQYLDTDHLIKSEEQGSGHPTVGLVFTNEFANIAEETDGDTLKEKIAQHSPKLEEQPSARSTRTGGKLWSSLEGNKLIGESVRDAVGSPVPLRTTTFPRKVRSMCSLEDTNTDDLFFDNAFAGLQHNSTKTASQEETKTASQEDISPFQFDSHLTIFPEDLPAQNLGSKPGTGHSSPDITVEHQPPAEDCGQETKAAEDSGPMAVHQNTNPCMLVDCEPAEASVVSSDPVMDASVVNAWANPLQMPAHSSVIDTVSTGSTFSINNLWYRSESALSNGTPNSYSLLSELAEPDQSQHSPANASAAATETKGPFSNSDRHSVEESVML